MFTKDELHVMEHALGIERALETSGYHYKRHGKQYVKSYRNYYCADKGHDEYMTWKRLVDRHYADFWYDGDYVYFKVSDSGKEELQKQREYEIKWI